MSRIVTVSDIDETLTAEDSILAFFDRFGKRRRAEQVWQWSRANPEKIESEFGIPRSDVRPSMDVELVLKEILAEGNRIDVAEFEKTARSTALAPGAKKLMATASSLGDVFLLSAMFQPQAEAFARRLGVPAENAVATRLFISGRRVTGFLGPLMEGTAKADALDVIAKQTGIPLSRFAGIGDSASDAPFIRRIVRAGGLGMAVTGDTALNQAGAVRVENLAEAGKRLEAFGEKMEKAVEK
ncbi:MAG: HAD family hydrolase [Candidatus Micrarchaeota archaeon]|nr:HAD family hydrolase [Candidatus Micrarchaeota archaeon]